MQIDRAAARAAFAGYAARYNEKDPKVRLKIDHTYRVAALCARIAAEQGLNAAGVDLAWLCGLLHDVGRFEQLRRYGTFNDAESIDHAACSAEVLFDRGQIRQYTPDAAEDALLRTAVAWHSAYRLPADLDPRTRLYCDLLRDADKIDILRVNVETPLEEIYNVTTEQLRAAAITPAVEQAFYEHHAVLRTLKRTPVDNVVGHLSLVYELVFAASRRIVRQQGWLERLLAFDSANPDTAQKLAAMQTHLHAWLAENA